MRGSCGAPDDASRRVRDGSASHFAPADWSKLNKRRGHHCALHPKVLRPVPVSMGVGLRKVPRDARTLRDLRATEWVLVTRT
jgi:hypothetical protein